MKIKNVALSEIKVYESNAKTHTPLQIQHLKNSIKEFGFSVPIVVNSDNVILAGHGRYIAAQSMGMETIPVICVSHLTPEQERAYRLADNSTQLMSGFDYEVLQSELSELFNFNTNDFGFGFQIDTTENPEYNEQTRDYSGHSREGGDASAPRSGESPVDTGNSQEVTEYTCPGCGATFSKVGEVVDVEDKLAKAMEGLT